MADRVLTRARTAGLLRRSDAVRIGVIYVAARVITTVFLYVGTLQSTAASRFGQNATLGDFILGWDAQWYWFTAVNGYPGTLPLTDAGQVAENQWAFMPVYPYLSALVGLPFGAWGAGAVLVSLAAGYGACLVLYRMLRLRLDPAAATWAVVFFACSPLAALFQVGYAESLFLVELFAALYCVMRRRYVWLYLLVPLMAYTRPGVLAFALLLGILAMWRFARRRVEPWHPREPVHLVVLAVLALVLGLSWQVFAAIATGDPQAYLATELAWRRNWIPDAAGGFVPFEGFFAGVGFWFTLWGMNAWVGIAVLVVVVVGVAALLLFEPHVRRLGVEVRLWSASYLLYLLAVFFPQTSIFRLLLPLSPLWGAVAAPRSTPWRVGVLVASLVGQWWWIYNMYALANTYWQVP